MSSEEKVIHFMNTYLPSDTPLKDGCVTYRSVLFTHNSYRKQLNNSQPLTPVRYWYLRRCYDWLLLLKKNNIPLHNIIK